LSIQIQSDQKEKQKNPNEQAREIWESDALKIQKQILEQQLRIIKIWWQIIKHVFIDDGIMADLKII
jgi:hypothetical protein